jgi:hypothetical protein
MASFAAGTMVLISGIFALIFGNIIIDQDVFTTDWDPITDEELNVVDPGAFFAGAMFIAGFTLSLVSTYCSYRLTRYELAMLGPLTLIVAYFSLLAYEPFVMLLTVHILVMSIVSLGLLYYAIPIYAGRKARNPIVDYNEPLPPPGAGIG